MRKPYTLIQEWRLNMIGMFGQLKGKNSVQYLDSERTKHLTCLSKIWNQLKDLALVENKQIFPKAVYSRGEY